MRVLVTWACDCGEPRESVADVHAECPNHPGEALRGGALLVDTEETGLAGAVRCREPEQPMSEPEPMAWSEPSDPTSWKTWRSRLFGTETCRVFIPPQGIRIVRWFPR